MKAYPKTIHSTSDLIMDLQNKGMIIPDVAIATEMIDQIGYYRLRGYAFHFLDKCTNKFVPETTLTASFNFIDSTANCRRYCLQ